MVAVGVVITLSPLAHPLGFTPLPWQFFTALVVIVVVYLVLVEMTKKVFYADPIQLRRTTAPHPRPRASDPPPGRTVQPSRWYHPSLIPSRAGHCERAAAAGLSRLVVLRALFELAVEHRDGGIAVHQPTNTSKRDEQGGNVMGVAQQVTSSFAMGNLEDPHRYQNSRSTELGIRDQSQP